PDQSAVLHITAKADQGMAGQCVTNNVHLTAESIIADDNHQNDNDGVQVCVTKGNDDDDDGGDVQQPCVAGPAYASSILSDDQGTRKNGSAVLAERSDPTNALGAPNTDFYSLGFTGGQLAVGFAGQVVNVDGVDLSFHEVTNGRDSYPEERADVEVSQNGTDWESVGTVSGRDDLATGISYLDFDGTSFDWIKYVRMTE